MEKNRKNFLHKVVEFLVKDTIIDYGDNHIDLPFFPMYRLYISDENLEYHYFHKDRFIKYCRDHYGLTEEETFYVWGIYIGMIKEKININDGSLNESDDRRKNFLDKDTINEGWSDTFYQSMESKRRKYIDKVIKFLVIDTKVDYEDNHIDFPFFPSYRLYINDGNLGYHYHKDRFIKYCREQYGLTEEETFYVWFKYIITVKNNIKTEGGTINESDDRRKNFLDKVVDFLVKDTKVDYEDRELFFPFTLKKSLRQNSDNSTPFHKILFNKDSVIPRDGFMEYIDEMYGVNTIEEISYVWGKYKDVMRYTVFGNDPTSEPIYESENSRQDLIDNVDNSVKNLLDKIIAFILKETMIDYRNSTWTPPFLPEAIIPSDYPMYNPTAILYFKAFCEESYGIYDEGEQIYIWESYRRLLDMKMKSNPINESDDRRKNFLDKVVDFLVKDTSMEYSVINYVSYPWDPETPLLFNSQTDLKYSHDYFREYVIETYGLTLMDEVLYVWEELRRKIGEKLFTGDTINESDDKKQVYLNKIIDWLVSDTDVGGLWFNPPYKTGLIHAENSITLFSLYKQTFNLLKHVTDEEEIKFVIQMNYFKRFCKEQYGLTEDEIDYVWRGYMKNLYESEKYNSLNESDDKRQKYLDKVINWMVEDTAIDWKEERVRFPYLSDYNFGFSQIPFSTLGGPPTTPFIEYCKYRYGLLSDEIDYVWGFYKDIILDKYEKESKLRDFNDINFYDMMNESEDKKQVYLDKIVDWLVGDTEVNVKQSWINPPYYYPGSSAGRTGFRLLYGHTFGLLKNTNYSGLETQLIYFNGYCKNNYGLTEDETTIVWRQYIRKLYDSYDWGVY